MNNFIYKRNLIRLFKDLERAGMASPFDPDAYSAIANQLNDLPKPDRKHRRRRPWLMILILWISFGALVGLIIRILFL